jgi:hypothetical protein
MGMPEKRPQAEAADSLGPIRRQLPREGGVLRPLQQPNINASCMPAVPRAWCTGGNIGKLVAYAWARLHGYFKTQIRQAEKCLR